MEIIKNITGVDNNVRDDSRGPDFYERKQVANCGSKKRVYNKIFMIASCKYKIWELVFSFMFIFNQVRFSTYFDRGLLGIYVRPLVSGRAVEQMVTKLWRGFQYLNASVQGTGFTRFLICDTIAMCLSFYSIPIIKVSILLKIYIRTGRNNIYFASLSTFVGKYSTSVAV